MVNAEQGTGQPRLPQAPHGSFPCSLRAQGLWLFAPWPLPSSAGSLARTPRRKEPFCLVPSRFWEESRCGGIWQQHFILRLPPRPGRRLARRAHLPCQTGTRCRLSSSDDPALAQKVYYPLAGTLCLAPPCSAVPLPLPSYPLGSRPGSHLHPPTLPGSPCHPASLNRLQAGSQWGWGAGLASPCLFCCGQGRLGGHGHLPFLASIRLVNSCPISHKCFCLWLRLLSVFLFLWFVWT